jgi:hypothetical protein
LKPGGVEMKRNLIITITIIILGCIVYLPVFADNTAKKDADERTSLLLSTKLQRLLSAEMNSVQYAMTNLTVAIPAGDWRSIAENARSMRNGYILVNKLSKEEMKEFNYSLPEGYKKIEEDFRQTAKDMIEAASRSAADDVNLAFYKLNGTCIKCHIKYAKRRFPGLKK